MDYDHITDTTRLERATAYRILRAGRLMRIHLQKVLHQQGTDLSPEQWMLLFRLNSQDGCLTTELADPLLQDFPNVSRLVNGLARQHLVERRADPDDGRRSRVYMTPAGQELVERMLVAVVAIRRRLFEDIPAEDVGTLITVLDRIEQRILEELD